MYLQMFADNVRRGPHLCNHTASISIAATAGLATAPAERLARNRGTQNVLCIIQRATMSR